MTHPSDILTFILTAPHLVANFPSAGGCLGAIDSKYKKNLKSDSNS